MFCVLLLKLVHFITQASSSRCSFGAYANSYSATVVVSSPTDVSYGYRPQHQGAFMEPPSRKHATASRKPSPYVSHGHVAVEAEVRSVEATNSLKIPRVSSFLIARLKSITSSFKLENSQVFSTRTNSVTWRK